MIFLLSLPLLFSSLLHSSHLISILLFYFSSSSLLFSCLTVLKEDPSLKLYARKWLHWTPTHSSSPSVIPLPKQNALPHRPMNGPTGKYRVISTLHNSPSSMGNYFLQLLLNILRTRSKHNLILFTWLTANVCSPVALLSTLWPWLTADPSHLDKETTRKKLPPFPSLLFSLIHPNPHFSTLYYFIPLFLYLFLPVISMHNIMCHTIV